MTNTERVQAYSAHMHIPTMMNEESLFSLIEASFVRRLAQGGAPQPSHLVHSEQDERRGRPYPALPSFQTPHEIDHQDLASIIEGALAIIDDLHFGANSPQHDHPPRPASSIRGSDHRRRPNQ